MKLLYYYYYYYCHYTLSLVTFHLYVVISAKFPGVFV